jgi:hypothetical protein
MVGATITACKLSPEVMGTTPNSGYQWIYFSCTLDSSAKASFADYTAVVYIKAVDNVTLVPEAATAYTAGGDITFTNINNPINGIALVKL